MMKFQIRERHTVWIFILLAITTRFFTFFDTVIDHDESTYLIIGQQLSGGADLYVDLIDLKPPMGLWLFALLYKVLGTSIPLYRLFLSILIGITAYLIYRIVKLMKMSPQSAWLAGVMYVLINLFHHALSFNLEHWMNLFTVFGFFIFLGKKTNRSLYWASFLIGISFSIKYLSLLDFGGIMLVFSYFFWKGRLVSLVEGVRFLTTCFIALLAFSIPFLMINFHFWFFEDWEAFRFITYEAPSRYKNSKSMLNVLDAIWGFHLQYIAYCIPFYVVLFSKSISKDFRVLSVIWFVLALVAMELTGRSFAHYAIQCFPVLCMTAGAILDIPVMSRWAKWTEKRRYALLVVVMIVGLTFNYFDYYLDKDPEGEIVQYLEENGISDQEVVPIDAASILNFILEQKPRTPYVHATLLFLDFHIKTLDIDVPSEMEKMKNPPPAYLVLKNKSNIHPSLEFFISEHYQLEQSFHNKLRLYRYSP